MTETQEKQLDFELGMIGGGNMAEAVVRGALLENVLGAGEILVADPDEGRREVFQSLDVATTSDNVEVVSRCRRILLAVKPQMFADLADVLGTIDSGTQPIFSIMTGISNARIQAAAGSAARVVRVMPNTPLLVAAGMSAVARGPSASDADVEFARRIFSAAGRVVEVQEGQMDAITAVSGSGPAYLFYLAEAMMEAAEKLGLGSEAAGQLVEQTLVGSARLLQDSDASASELRARVTSRKGTTEAAIARLDAGQVRETVIQAIEAGARRSVELGR